MRYLDRLDKYQAKQDRNFHINLKLVAENLAFHIQILIFH